MRRRLRLDRSVVTRLALSIVFAGLLVSAALGFVEWKRSEAVLRVEVTQHMVQVVRQVQGRVRAYLNSPDNDTLRPLLQGHLADPRIRGARITFPGEEPLTILQWPQLDPEQVAMWRLAESDMPDAVEVDLQRVTLVKAPFSTAGGQAELELLIDGPAVYTANFRRILNDLAMNWLFLAVMVLAGLLLVRRWFTGPLTEISDLVAANTGPESFYRIARNSHSEFAELAEAIGGMLTRLENTTDRLRKREQAFENLYQFAPAAMLSLDLLGRVLEANRRAAELLHAPSERRLSGSQIMDYVKQEDRPLLRQTIDKLTLDNAARCELRLIVEEKIVHAAVECVAVRDEDEQLNMIRLSLVDISESTALQAELADKSRLLNLVIDHMSDAILLIDAEGNIAAVNQQLSALLHTRGDTLIGEKYNAQRFWEEIGVLDRDLFIERISQIDADGDRPAQERFESRQGTFLFQGIPVHDTDGDAIGRLWVVSEVTSQEQNQKLLDQQTSQLQALKRLGHQLCQINSVEALMEQAPPVLYELFGVEAMGLALRRDEGELRSYQVLHRGAGTYLLEPNQTLVRAIEEHLMPHLMANRDVNFWPDLPSGSPWAKAFGQAGLTCVAGAPLIGGADPQGILWIARRGGERLERHQIYLLEAIAPALAGRVDILQMHDRMLNLHLTDLATGLPNAEHLRHEMDKVAARTANRYAVLKIRLDHWDKLAEMLEGDSADHLLRTVAVALKRSMRKSCFVARLRGASFGVLAPLLDLDAAIPLGNRLLNVISAQQIALPDGRSWRLTASIGLASAPEDGADVEQVIHLANARLEVARRSGRDRVVADGPAATDRRVG